MKKKLLIVDMNIVWPPDGGAPVDLRFLMPKLSQDFEVTLLIPRITRLSRTLSQPWPLSRTKFFQRGNITNNVFGVSDIQYIDFTLTDLVPTKFISRVQIAASSINPDFVFIGDAWYFKPYLSLALKSYPTIIRIYSYENICMKGNGSLFRHNNVCSTNFLDGSRASFKTCRTCAISFYASYPSPRWVAEYLLSSAWNRDYQRLAIDGFNRAKAVIVGNHAIAHRMASFISTDLVPMPHGIDTSLFKTERFVRSDRSVFRFLISGRMDDPKKGLANVLNAADRIWAHRSDFEVLVTSERGLPKRPYLKRIPWVPYERVAEIYKMADALIIPSLWPDPFPIVVLEAMASGLPVIGTNIGGIPEEISHQETGFVYTSHDWQQLQIYMLKLLDDRSLAFSMGQSGVLRARELFDIEHVYERKYRPLLSRVGLL